jgi:hemolysin activation/secretion protein
MVPAALAALAAGEARAEEARGFPALERLHRPGGVGEFLPELPPAGAPSSKLQLPPVAVPAPAAPSAGAAGPQFLLRDVRIEGGTVFDPEALAAIWRPFVGRPVGAADLEELRQRLSRAYADQGYLNSGAVLPDQEVGDGTVTYRLIEGRVSEIEIVGARHFDPAYLTSRLELAAGPPFRIENLANRLQILAQDPAIKRLNLDLAPGIEPGTAKLTATVEEARPITVTTAFANSQSPSVGDLRGDVEAEARNLLGHGEALRLRYGRTGGVNDGGAFLSVPVTPWDTLVHVKFDRSAADVVSANLAALDIRSESTTYEAGLTQPVYRSAENSLSLGLTVAKRRSETFLLGEHFDFTPGMTDGRAEINVARFIQEWQNRSRDHALVLRSTLSHGLLMFGATNTGVKPDGDFTAWLGQTQAVMRLPEDWQLVLRGDVQLSDRPLYGLEQFSLGGMNSVRGYRENEVVADDGLFGSLELRVPVYEFPVPAWSWLMPEEGKGRIALAPFYDQGQAWSQKGSAPGTVSLRAAGVGLRLDLADVLEGQFYYGFPLDEIRHGDHNLQDESFHFRLLTKVRF